MKNSKSERRFARVRRVLANRRAAFGWAEGVLSLIIFSATLLSLYWTFTVPILQNPDESSHIDYGFSIYSAGRLLNVRRAPSEWNVHKKFAGRADREGIEQTPYDLLSHQYTLYLIDATDFHRIRFHADEKVAPDYGSAAYYRRLDANAPQVPANIADLQPADNPWMLTAYPFGYYAALAAWMKILSLFVSGPAALFLGARIFSVVLLTGSLVLSYATLRELRLRKARALALTAIVAFFPLTPFITSSVQPDNLTLLLVLLCFYPGLRLRHSDLNDRRLVIALGGALGALVVTKYHIFLFTVLAVLGIVISEHIFRRKSALELLRNLALLSLPSLLLFAVQLWVVKGERITGGNLHRASGVLIGVRNAILDYYRGGPAFVSWWGRFGWMDTVLTIRSPGVELRLLTILSALTLLILGLLIFRLEQVITRLVVLVARGRWRLALRIAFSNPLLTSHFLFSIFMIFLYAFTGNSFFAQGRHWFPYILSGFFITTQFAPRALSHRRTQSALSTLLILGLMSYCLVAGYYSVQAIKERYYAAQSAATACVWDSPSAQLSESRVAVKTPTVEWYL